MVRNNIWQEWRWNEGYLFLVRACQGSGDCVIMLIHQTSAKQILIKPKEQRSEATRCEASDWNRLLRNHCSAMAYITCHYPI